MKHLSDNRLFRQAMQLRMHMSFLVDNIYTYLQVDVLETQWQELKKGLAKSSDFEEVCKLHDKYLSIITEQCFLNHPEVLKAIQDIIFVAQKLCRFLGMLDENELLTNEEVPEKFV